MIWLPLISLRTDREGRLLSEPFKMLWVNILTFEGTIAVKLEDLNEIIEGCVSGEARAQERLYRLFAPKMFGVCLRFSKDRSEAEDNLQEGFVKIFTSIKGFRHEGSLEGWIRRIMVNVSLEKLRKNTHLFPVEDMSVYEGEWLTDGIMDRISSEELIGLIQDLPPRYRMVFNLYVMEGFNHQEISNEMNISVGTSKSNLSRAREILKQKVSVYYNESGIKTNYSA